MRKALLFTLIAATVMMTGCGMMRRGELSILTFNVRSSNPANDDVREYRAIASFIDLYNPNVAALQGVDFVTGTKEGIDAISMFASFADRESGFTRNALYNDHSYGVGILSVNNPLTTESFVLPGEAGDPVAILHEYSDCVIMSVHLSADALDQLETVAILDSVARERGKEKPMFVCGVFNFTSGTEAFDKMSENFEIVNDPAVPSYPLVGPQICIDHIWAYTGSGIKYRREAQRVLFPPRLTAHAPLLVVVSFEKPKPKR